MSNTYPPRLPLPLLHTSTYSSSVPSPTIRSSLLSLHYPLPFIPYHHFHHPQHQPIHPHPHSLIYTFHPPIYHPLRLVAPHPPTPTLQLCITSTHHIHAQIRIYIHIVVSFDTYFSLHTTSWFTAHGSRFTVHGSRFQFFLPQLCGAVLFMGLHRHQLGFVVLFYFGAFFLWE